MLEKLKYLAEIVKNSEMVQQGICNLFMGAACLCVSITLIVAGLPTQSIWWAGLLTIMAGNVLCLWFLWPLLVWMMHRFPLRTTA